jgi:hypothetical protein
MGARCAHYEPDGKSDTLRSMISPMCARAAVLALALAFSAGAAESSFDVVVVSGSSGGVAAALAAGRMGARVALVEDTPVLGGMLANGISNIDTYSYESLSGIFEEFRARVREHYRPVQDSDPIFHSPAAAPRPSELKGRQSNSPLEGGRWEPHVADRIFRAMVAQVPSITVFYDTWATGVVMRGRRIAGVTTENKSGERATLLGKVVIDATHEADVAAWAGAPYRVGREPRSPLEPHAGDIYFFNGTGEIMEGSTGRGDAAVVSYGLRLCIRHYGPEDGDRHILKTPPPGYDKSQYLLAGHVPDITMPGRKGEMNANPVGNEMQEVNWSWPEADRAGRRRLYEMYRAHALGFLYFLQHERGFRQVGLPTDEFIDNGNVPYRVFVREARRIEGEATMTEADVNPFVTGRGLKPPARADSIAIGHYAIDSKPVRSKTDASTPEKGAGDFFLGNTTAPFQVPYGAIVPRGVDGLLVPVAMSATHIAFSAVRMDPTWVAMGQAAGTAAVLALREGVAVRSLAVEKLQRELIRQKARLVFYWDVPIEHPSFAAVQWLSVRRGMEGYLNRQFRPDQALTRAEAAVLLARALNLWPSVSNFHFADVPWSHWAFRDIETLFDHRLLGAFGIHPRWPEAGGFDAPRYSGFVQNQNFGGFEPEKPVTWAELVDLLREAGERRAESPGAGIVRSQPRPPGTGHADWARRVVAGSAFAAPIDPRPEAPITRGEAAMVVAAACDVR